MSELIATARNIHHRIDGENLRTEIEAVITVMNRQIDIDSQNKPKTVAVLDTLRFTLDIKQARELSDYIDEWIEDALDEAERLTVKPNPQPNDGSSSQ